MGAALSWINLIYTQFFPPKATLTGDNLPNQKGKVFIVTGGNGVGIGFELAKLLYQAEGRVYIMTRNEEKSKTAIAEIENSRTSTPGTIKFIKLDLGDLRTVSSAVESFIAQEQRLDVLFNNAGMASAPFDLKTAQGLEPHFGVNCAGHFLPTKLLHPILEKTAKADPINANKVRVIWTSSVLVEILAPKGGVTISELSNPSKNRDEHYSASKAGNWFLASEFHRRYGSTGVLHLTQNPGSLRTNTWRNTPWYKYYPYVPLLSQPIYGAYTNVWAAFSDEITMSDGGRYIIPWGRWHPGQREDIVLGLKSKDEGGTGRAMEFWDWCEAQVKPFTP
ncbi:MAG: hypothetical protein M1820_005457 [Bogoriella megaspora]|nr:MAG: hypothetical protein M1820_005457 [Bogoriella megaspora]